MDGRQKHFLLDIFSNTNPIAPKEENNRNLVFLLPYLIWILRILNSTGFVNLGQNFFKFINKHLKHYLILPQGRKPVPNLSMLPLFG